MNRKELKKLAVKQLGGEVFGSVWMMALLVCLVAGAMQSALSAMWWVPMMVFGGVVSIGSTYVLLKRARDGKNIHFPDVFYGFSKGFGDNVVLSLLTNVYTLLWSLLFIVPGIVKSYSYSLVYLIRLDKPGLSASETITESRRMMNGHKGELFLLDLSFLGWYVLSIFTFGAIGLWVKPYHELTRINFYEKLRVENETKYIESTATEA